MRFLDLTLGTPEENLALDEALLLSAEGEGGEILRIWEWPRPAVVLGSGGKIADDVDVLSCQRDQVPILRRASGGGTVLLGTGCLLYSLVLSIERSAEMSDIRRSYAYILSRVNHALQPEASAAEICGTSDLAIGGRKFSGNAQQRKQRHILHHGTLLFAFDASIVSNYLLPPPRQPEYRGGRTHTDFLMNLSLSKDTIIARLREEWGAAVCTRYNLHADVARLAVEKYSLRAWIERR
jgi:lipoate-protein ligase A